MIIVCSLGYYVYKPVDVRFDTLFRHIIDTHRSITRFLSFGARVYQGLMYVKKIIEGQTVVLTVAEPEHEQI